MAFQLTRLDASFLHLVKILTRYDLLSKIISPSTIVPLSSFFAASASNLSTKVTNPNPFDPLSLKIISTSWIVPNFFNKNLVLILIKVISYAKHLSEIGVAKSERNIWHVKSFWFFVVFNHLAVGFKRLLKWKWVHRNPHFFTKFSFSFFFQITKTLFRFLATTPLFDLVWPWPKLSAGSRYLRWFYNQKREMSLDL